MIVRSAVRCATCEQLHVVRIGVGYSEAVHKFACRSCKEQIGVALKLDPKNARAWIEFEENAIEAKEEPGAEIVNLDSNFLIPQGVQGKEGDFNVARLTQMMEFARRSYRGDDDKTPSGTGGVVDIGEAARHFDFATEWKLLRKAWSLQRNGQLPFSRARVREVSTDLYRREPLNGLADWLWRFALKLNGSFFGKLFSDAMTAIDQVYGNPGFKHLLAFYDTELVAVRGTRYFRIVNDFFNGYSEFAQVHFRVMNGMEIPEGYQAASTDFQKTAMFYGNCFEVLSDSVDLLACINNLMANRRFDTFEKLTLKRYYELDKASRFGAFAGSPALAALTTEADNQLRNASHHGGIEFDAGAGVLSCRSGKGGQGPARTMTYTEYLTRCVRIMEEILMIMRIELLFSSMFGTKPPL